jgi:hypothetical protein
MNHGAHSFSCALKEANDPVDNDRFRNLVLHRIYPINAFEAVSRLSIDDALSLLLRRYAGKHAEPDGKFGGFSFELSSMLDDLFHHHGEEGLRRLISMPDFNRDALSDPRVVASFCEALDMDHNEFRNWIAGEGDP